MSGCQVGLALVAFLVLQTPPLTEPTHRVAESVGWTTTAWIAPETSLFGARFRVWPPVIGAGPWATQGPPRGGLWISRVKASPEQDPYTLQESASEPPSIPHCSGPGSGGGAEPRKR